MDSITRFIDPHGSALSGYAHVIDGELGEKIRIERHTSTDEAWAHLISTQLMMRAVGLSAIFAAMGSAAPDFLKQSIVDEATEAISQAIRVGQELLDNLINQRTDAPVTYVLKLPSSGTRSSMIYTVTTESEEHLRACITSLAADLILAGQGGK